jgi:hypothetical protein
MPRRPAHGSPRLPAPLAFLLAPLTGVGCGSTRVCNPALERCDAHQGGEPFAGEAGPAALTWGCCAAGDPGCEAGAWWFDLWSDGSLSGATLTVLDASSPFQGWSEAHPVGLYARDPDGWWENRYLEIDIAAGTCTPPAQCASAYTAGQVTAFPCRPADALPWTFRLDAEDRSGAAFTCVAFGAADPQTEACLAPEEL